ncbi:MAG: hypothetical protein HRT53_19615 [Colwellia sp.]|nr:hypothetical protein [Colwellia sp.]
MTTMIRKDRVLNCIVVFGIFISLFVVASLITKAQATLPNSDFIEQALKIMQTEESYDQPDLAIQKILNIPCKNKDIDALLKKIKYQANKDIKLLEMDLESGLRISHDSNSSAYIGLAFHLLGGGYYENKLTQKIMAAEYDLFQLKAVDKQKKNQALCQQAALSKIFSQYRIQAIEDILSYSSDYIRTLKKSYFSKQIFIDEIIKEEKRVQEITLLKAMNERQYATISQKKHVKKSSNLLPLFDLDINEILYQHQSSQQQAKLKKLQETLLNKERDSLIQQKLKLYVRYGTSTNLADDNSFNNLKDEWTLGLRYSLPLFSGKKHFKNYQVDKKALDFAITQADIEKQLRSSYVEHQNKLTAAIDIQFNLSLSRERLRRALFEYQEQNNLASQNLLNKQLLEYFYSKLALVNTTELLYRNFVNIQLYNKAPYDKSQLIKVNIPSPLDNRARHGKRSILIEKNSIFINDIDAITKLFFTKNIDTAVFNIDIIKQPKYQELVQKLGRYKIKHSLAIRIPDINQQLKALPELLKNHKNLSLTIGPIENEQVIEHVIKTLFLSFSLESISRISLQFVLTSPSLQVINIELTQWLALLDNISEISHLKKEPVTLIDLSKINSEQALEEHINRQLANQPKNTVFLKNLRQLMTLFSYTGNPL